MRYLVRINELEKKIDYLKKQLDVIDENILRLEKEKTLIKWKGQASVLFLDKYDQFIMWLRSVEKSTVVYLDYLMQYYNKYGEEYTNFKKKYARFFKSEVADEHSSI